tara:strand:- start:1581 stop:2477 length:897 start_codon:yes stop_codon:yes gene_type:complete
MVQDNKSRYLREINTPTPFNEGPEMQNYNRMMDLQSQASNFTQNDPRFNQLKDARRQYNRNDKYTIGNRQDVAPLDVQQNFSNQSNVFRNNAPNVYGKMYPVSDLAMKYGESGGLMGMMAKEMFGKVSDFGKSMTDKVGITGMVDSDEEEMEEYAAQTFGSPGTPYPQEDFPITYPQDKPINTDMANNKYYNDLNQAEIDYLMGRTEAIADEDMNVAAAPTPFNDNLREAGIMSQYGQGPTYGSTNRRYEKEYRDFTASLSDTTKQFGPVPYEEFAEMYEKMFQGKPQVGFSKTLVNR